MEYDMRQIINLKIVPEKIIVDANEACVVIGEEDNSFGRLLEQGQEYRKAGLTPLYVLNEDNVSMTVTAKELVNYQLH
jgi:hypothetical protein